eukprot:scpid20880/ scgid2905/ Jouberin; Abelson helper integration site 1 protein homolog
MSSAESGRDNDSEDLLLTVGGDGRSEEQAEAPKRRRRKPKTTSRPSSAEHTRQRPLPEILHENQTPGTDEEEILVERRETDSEGDRKLRHRRTHGQVTSAQSVAESSAQDHLAHEIDVVDVQDADDAMLHAATSSEPAPLTSITQIVIHGASVLKSSTKLLQPVVRVSIVDSETGQLFPLLHTSARDGSLGGVSHIQPVQTEPFPLHRHRTLAPKWQESLFIREDMEYFLESPNTLLLFEILDARTVKNDPQGALSFVHKFRKNFRSPSDPNWHCLAWAFLKLKSNSVGHGNTRDPTQLQLFKVPKILTIHQSLSDNSTPQVFRWWKSSQRVTYAASLTVTVREHVLSSDEVQAAQQPAGPEVATITSHQEDVAVDLRKETIQQRQHSNFNLAPCQVPESSVKWSRFPGQSCDVPNKEVLRLSSGSHGCTVVKFSHSGRLLAVACGQSELFGAILYEIPGGSPRAQLLAHHNIVYDLSWSMDDAFLATASADGTVRIWNMVEPGNVDCKVLPHPCFVYAAQYHPANTNLLASGGFDRLLRVWTTSQPAQLCQELEGHVGMINTLCFDIEGQHLFSGDSEGTVIVWSSPSQLDEQWCKIKVLQDPKAAGVSVTSLRMATAHPYMLVQRRNSSIQMYHSQTYRLVNTFKGLVNWKERIRSCVSPCGGLVFSGSEDRSLCVWASATGLPAHQYDCLFVKSTAVDVTYHPFEHMIALCTHTVDEPVLVFKRDASTRPATTVTGSSESALQQQQSLMATVKGGMGTSMQLDSRTTTAADTTPGLQSLHHSSTRTAAHSKRTARVASRTLEQVHQADSRADAGSTLHTERSQPLLASTAGLRKGAGYMPSSQAKKTGMSFGDVATQGMRLQKLAAKLDAVLKENKALDSELSDTTKTVRPPPTFTASTSANANIRNVKARLDDWRMHAGTNQGEPDSMLDGQSSLAASTYPGEQTQASGTLGTSALSWNTVWDGSPLPAESSRSNNAPMTSTRKSRKAPPASHDWKSSKQLVITMYDYEAVKETELTFDTGEEMRILVQSNEHWWYAEAQDGRRGYIPVSYVKGKVGQQEQHAKTDDRLHTTSSRDGVQSTLSDRPSPSRGESSMQQRSMSLDSRTKPTKLKKKYGRRPSTTGRRSVVPGDATT